MEGYPASSGCARATFYVKRPPLGSQVTEVRNHSGEITKGWVFPGHHTKDLTISSILHPFLQYRCNSGRTAESYTKSSCTLKPTPKRRGLDPGGATHLASPCYNISLWHYFLQVGRDDSPEKTNSHHSKISGHPMNSCCEPAQT